MFCSSLHPLAQQPRGSPPFAKRAADVIASGELLINHHAGTSARRVVRLAAPAAVPDAVEAVEVALWAMAEGRRLELRRRGIGDDLVGLGFAGDAAVGLGFCAVVPFLGGVAADEIVCQELTHFFFFFFFWLVLREAMVFVANRSWSKSDERREEKKSFCGEKNESNLEKMNL